MRAKRTAQGCVTRIPKNLPKVFVKSLRTSERSKIPFRFVLIRWNWLPKTNRLLAGGVFRPLTWEVRLRTNIRLFQMQTDRQRKPMPRKSAVDQLAAVQQRDQRNRWLSLCNSARRGDGDAFGEICERLRPHLLRVADRDLGKDLRSKVAAADIVQASMLEALGGFDHFVGDSEADFRAWVERILSNNLIDFARHYRWRKNDVPLVRSRSIPACTARNLFPVCEPPAALFGTKKQMKNWCASLLCFLNGADKLWKCGFARA